MEDTIYTDSIICGFEGMVKSKEDKLEKMKECYELNEHNPIYSIGMENEILNIDETIIESINSFVKEKNIEMIQEGRKYLINEISRIQKIINDNLTMILFSDKDEIRVLGSNCIRVVKKNKINEYILEETVYLLGHVGTLDLVNG